MTTLLNLFLPLFFIQPNLFENTDSILGVKSVSVSGNTACAILEDHSVKCWGSGKFGKLGLGDILPRGNSPLTSGDNLARVGLAPSDIPIQIANYQSFVCVLFKSGTVKCWGHNSTGQLGYEDTMNRGDDASRTPAKYGMVEFGKDLKVVRLASGTGGQSACAIFEDGRLKCWGDNLEGQLGLGVTQSVGDQKFSMGENLPFVPLPKGKSVVDVALGLLHACALLNTSEIVCWGYGEYGQLGTGNSASLGGTPKTTPDLLIPLDLGVTDSKAVQIVAGAFHSCALFENGRAKCWGRNNRGELGLGHAMNMGATLETIGEKLPYSQLTDDELPIQQLFGLHFGTCFLFINSSMKCVGANERGNFGFGDAHNRGGASTTIGDKLEFIEFGNAEGIRQASGSASHTCIVSSKGALKCVGQNDHGQLGYGDTYSRGSTFDTTLPLLPRVDLGTKVK